MRTQQLTVSRVNGRIRPGRAERGKRVGCDPHKNGQGAMHEVRVWRCGLVFRGRANTKGNIEVEKYSMREEGDGEFS